MAFTKLNEDLQNISKLPDRPTLEEGYTAQILKERFDKAAQDIKNYINLKLLAELMSAGAADSLGCQGYDSIQQALDTLAGKLDDLDAGNLQNDSISPQKLSGDLRRTIEETGLTSSVFLSPGSHEFVPSRTGKYKITVVGGGGAGQSQMGGGMSGAVCIAWRSLEKGKSYPLTVGEGGKIDSTAGQNSTFDDIVAEGAYATGLVFRSYAGGKNADIIISGAASTTDLMMNDQGRSAGGDTIFGRGSRMDGEQAGIGAGGFGAISDQTVMPGGNGMVLIEYLGI